jgi:DNA polymerase-1
MNLYLDFETKDEYLDRKVGAGWVFKYHNQLKNIQDDDFKVLGAAVAMDDETPRFTADHKEITSLVLQADTIVMHNAQYDLGCLEVLGVDTRKLKVLDTLIIAKLFDNRLVSYSLDYLSKKYFNENKDNNLLNKTAEEIISKVDGNRTLDKYPSLSSLKRLNPENKTYTRELSKWVKRNMETLNILRPLEIARYACQDIVLTRKLLQVLLEKVDLKQAEYFSRFAIICVDIRKRGIGVDMIKLKALIEELSIELKQIKVTLEAKFGNGINLNSSQQLSHILLSLGYVLPKTYTGADGVNKEFFNAYIGDPLVELLKTYREMNKLYNDFLLKTLNMQSYTCPEALHGDPIGRIYPELNILAAVTGRFSSSNPNIQQIPKRSIAWGNKIRSIFIPPDASKQWISADYKEQEVRLQVHYAKKVNAPFVNNLVFNYVNNPLYDSHKKVASLLFDTDETNVNAEQRKAAKTINLGISYGMGINKLAISLNINKEDAQKILDSYNKKVPYLMYLNKKVMKKIKTTGHIQSISGRRLLRDLPQFTEQGESINFDYKALNKLIQGSAADQCLAAMYSAFDEGIEILSVVHDEINAQGTEEEAKKLKHIMETVIKLEIPVVAEVATKQSWGQNE